MPAADARRVVLKAGTSTVSNEDGRISLTRVAHLVEQVCQLRSQNRQVLIVSSGAVGIGKQVLSRHFLLSASLRAHLQGTQPSIAHAPGACAAAGQLGLMSLYDSLFGQYGITCSQLLVTAADFTSEEHRRNLQSTINELLRLGVVPILNENDAVTAQTTQAEPVFSDNDSLAALVAGELQADLLVLLTDVEGVLSHPPGHPEARLIPVFAGQDVAVGGKSAAGRGGMGSKIAAARRALDGGVRDVVIASGYRADAVTDIAAGRAVGTLFTHDPPPSSSSSAEPEPAGAVSDDARAAREAARVLAGLDSATRARAVQAVADALLEHRDEILAANAADMAAAEAGGTAAALVARLRLTEDKLRTLHAGISAIAQAEEPIGRALGRTLVAQGLVLQQQTTPIGVVLVIFESRPDSLPQIAALALRSGNGLLLKGGKEAAHSNQVLHRVVVDAVHAAAGVPRAVIGLVTSREHISDLLRQDDVIDLCIPRGSGALVSYIKANTRMPVLGHAEGVCHVFVDRAADASKAARVAVDAKVNYPAACNACETVLLHADIAASPLGTGVVRALRAAGVRIHGGPAALAEPALAALVDEPAAAGLNTEYGDLGVTVEVVGSREAAVEHIHAHGSGHTECIVTEDAEAAEAFLAAVDAACVFHNASTRFADGYRFGLGAEVGISTGRIHARGPVGIEGLLTTKWLLRSDDVHVVGDPELEYVHSRL